ncbi:MAG: NAD-dependent epimerase/dehydratase [Rhodospirillaceae bacterium TMED167]|nr:MAG: NAD-dependent epimerase/dehydratase [Rhodospirillaceae bacterium TMED167]
MNITILGSAGQIGAYLSDYLKDKGHNVTDVDIVNGVQYDLRVTPSTIIEKAIESADFVFFLAFDVGGSRYLKKYQHTFEFVNNNTRMMANTFRLLGKYKKRFVFASSQMSNMSYSPYGVMKRVGELHTTALKGLTVKFWNVYGIEKDMEKAHVITDFIRKGFEEGQFEMMTDGTEERQFLYAEDCCEALETVMENYTDFKPEDPLHITSFRSETIKQVASIIKGCFAIDGNYDIEIKPGLAKDSVQLDKRNEADNYILNWWVPNTTIDVGIRKVYNEMKKEYV